MIFEEKACEHDVPVKWLSSEFSKHPDLELELEIAVIIK